MQFTNQATIEIYADGADINDMREMAKLPEVTGFTTNPSLMKRAGVTNYLAFAKQVVAEFPSMPVSFEVFTQDPDQIKEEATILSSLGRNVYVKVPILSLDGQPNINLLRERNGDHDQGTGALGLRRPQSRGAGDCVPLRWAGRRHRC